MNDNQKNQDNQRNREHVNQIAEELQAIYDGTTEQLNDADEQYSLWDYYCDALDVKYVVDDGGEILAIKLLVAFGGPNIWVDTEDQEVKLNWWGARASAPIHPDVCEELVVAANEYTTFTRG